MCTLTYIPHSDGYTFTHNRDERQDRPTSESFRSKRLPDQTIYYPEDLEAHGSWIAFGTKGISVCLMNGGNKTYERRESYRQSRGLVVIHVFEYEDVETFYNNYNFNDIEPFTMVVRSSEGFWKITHNEGETFLTELNPAEKQIWSSTTLYTEEVREKRRHWFKDWLNSNPMLTPQNIRSFHKSAGEGDSENDLVMSRWGILKTLSITQLHVKTNQASLVYEDFVQNSRDEKSLRLP